MFYSMPYVNIFFDEMYWTSGCSIEARLQKNKTEVLVCNVQNITRMILGNFPAKRIMA